MFVIFNSRKNLRKSGTLCLVALLSTLSALFVNFALAMNPTDAAQKEWVLEQMSELGTPCTVYLSHDAIAVKYDKMGCRLVCKAPDWKVYCFQDKEKLVWVGDLSLFSAAVMGNPYAVPTEPNFPRLRKVGVGDFRGLKYSKYQIPHDNTYEAWFADELLVAPKIAEFISRLYRTPKLPNAPVFCYSKRPGASIAKDANQRKMADIDFAVDMRKGQVEVLRTNSWKGVLYSSSHFELTKNCKRVSDIIQVTFSSSKKHELNDMFDNVMFTTKFKKNGDPVK